METLKESVRYNAQAMDYMYRLKVEKVPPLLFYCLYDLIGRVGVGRSILQTREDEAKFRKFIQEENPNTVLEIGTANGVSALLASYECQEVITIDIIPFPIAEVLWHIFRKRDKIHSFIVNKPEKIELIKNLDFDFAFIDGDHSFEGVKTDFEAVSKCGKVLFHDYIYPGSDYDKWTKWGDVECGVKTFVDTLPKSQLTIKEPFALWKR